MTGPTFDNLASITNTSTVTKINENFDKVSDEYPKLLYADGSVEMTSELDANGYTIINLRRGVDDAEPPTMAQLRELENGGLVVPGPYAPYGPYTANIAPMGMNDVEEATNILGTTGGTRVTFPIDISSLLGATPAAQAAIDLGYTRGVQNNNTNPLAAGKIWYGGEAIDVNPGHWVTAEVGIITDTPNQFGVPRIVLIGKNHHVLPTGDLPSGIATHVMTSANRTKINDYVAIYRGIFQVPSDVDVYQIVVGTFALPIDGNLDGVGPWPLLTLFGGRYGTDPNQLALSPDDVGGGSLRLLKNVIMEGDWTGLQPVLLPDTWFTVGDRKQKVYVPSLLPSRTLGSDGMMLWQQPPTNAADDNPPTGGEVFAVRGRHILELDPAVMPANINVLYRAETNGNDSIRTGLASMTHVNTPLSNLYGKTASILMIADSLVGDLGMGHAMLRAARDTAAVTLTGVGSMSTDERLTNQPTPTSGVLIPSESRGGWRAGDFSGEGGDPVESYPAATASRKPLPTGATGAPSPFATWELYYASLSNDDRHKWNPMVRNPTVGDSDATKAKAWKPQTWDPTTDPAGQAIGPLNYLNEVNAGHSPDPTLYWLPDLEFWRTRFAATSIGTFAKPAMVYLGFGTNDITDYVDQFALYRDSNPRNPLISIEHAYSGFLHSIATDWPDVAVGIGVPTVSLAIGGKSRWDLFGLDPDDFSPTKPFGQEAWIRMALRVVKTININNPTFNVKLVPLYAATDPDAIYYDTRDRDGGGALTDSTDITQAATTADIYSEQFTAIEVVHHYGAAREQAGQIMWAWGASVVATKSGGYAGPIAATHTSTVARFLLNDNVGLVPTLTTDGNWYPDGAAFPAVVGDILLRVGQYNPRENGLWVYNGAAVQTRPPNYPTGFEPGPLYFVHVTDGQTYAGQDWQIGYPPNAMVDTDPTTWRQNDLPGVVDPNTFLCGNGTPTTKARPPSYRPLVWMDLPRAFVDTQANQQIPLMDALLAGGVPLSAFCDPTSPYDLRGAFRDAAKAAARRTGIVIVDVAQVYISGSVSFDETAGTTFVAYGSGGVGGVSIIQTSPTNSVWVPRSNTRFAGGMWRFQYLTPPTSTTINAIQINDGVSEVHFDADVQFDNASTCIFLSGGISGISFNRVKLNSGCMSRAFYAAGTDSSHVVDGVTIEHLSGTTSATTLAAVEIDKDTKNIRILGGTLTGGLNGVYIHNTGGVLAEQPNRITLRDFKAKTTTDIGWRINAGTDLMFDHCGIDTAGDHGWCVVAPKGGVTMIVPHAQRAHKDGINVAISTMRRCNIIAPMCADNNQVNSTWGGIGIENGTGNVTINGGSAGPSPDDTVVVVATPAVGAHTYGIDIRGTNHINVTVDGLDCSNVVTAAGWRDQTTAGGSGTTNKLTIVRTNCRIPGTAQPAYT